MFFFSTSFVFLIFRYFNGNAVNVDGNNIKLGTTPEGNHCLLIEKCNSLNSGEYEVVAKNDIGDTSTKAYLTVSCIIIDNLNYFHA